MSASVLASIIQSCKAPNKRFTRSPQDASLYPGYTPPDRAGQGEEREGGKEEEEEEEEEMLHFKARRENILKKTPVLFNIQRFLSSEEVSLRRQRLQ